MPLIIGILSVVVDVLIVPARRMESLRNQPRWLLDEGVTEIEEEKCEELIDRYARISPMELGETFVIHRALKRFIERYSALAFDEYSVDYTRDDFLQGESTVPCWRGFYCIGGDGGEMSFYVRIDSLDEKIYAFDMESSSRPEPYASNIRRFVVMRYNEWLKRATCEGGSSRDLLHHCYSTIGV